MKSPPVVLKGKYGWEVRICVLGQRAKRFNSLSSQFGCHYSVGTGREMVRDKKFLRAGGKLGNCILNQRNVPLKTCQGKLKL